MNVGSKRSASPPMDPHGGTEKRSRNASGDKQSLAPESASLVKGEGTVKVILINRVVVEDKTNSRLVVAFLTDVQRESQESGPEEGQAVVYEAQPTDAGKQSGCHYEATYMECKSSRAKPGRIVRMDPLPKSYKNGNRSESPTSSSRSKSSERSSDSASDSEKVEEKSKQPEPKKKVDPKSIKQPRVETATPPKKSKARSRSKSHGSRHRSHRRSTESKNSRKKHSRGSKSTKDIRETRHSTEGNDDRCKLRSPRRSTTGRYRSRSSESRRRFRRSNERPKERSPSPEFSRYDRFYGRGRITYSGPRCSLIIDWARGWSVFFYNFDFRSDGRPEEGMIVDFKAVPEIRYIAKHRMTTKWDAVRVKEVFDLRNPPPREPGIYRNASSPLPEDRRIEENPVVDLTMHEQEDLEDYAEIPRKCKRSERKRRAR